MGWESRLGKEDTLPERQTAKILDEMGLKYERNRYVETPFRDYPIEADRIVDDCLVIEVQSERFHMKTRRQRKDVAKRNCFKAMGFGVLWLWDKELEWAFQVKRGEVWRPAIKGWVTVALEYARELRAQHMRLLNLQVPHITHPDYGLIGLEEDRYP